MGKTIKKELISLKISELVPYERNPRKIPQEAIDDVKESYRQDHQYLMFLKYAWAHNCRVHCLGMTRKPVLDKVPFDYVDSSSWTQGVLYGRIGNRKIKNAPTVEGRRIMRQRQWEYAYKESMKMQEYYEAKWASPTRKMKEGLLNN